ncbi:MAG: hypothetical protein LUG99_18010 [Lachnospiraceae bacterium]|nr:hypothetical protein [Lachnospiraceae bacterium]
MESRVRGILFHLDDLCYEMQLAAEAVDMLCAAGETGEVKHGAIKVVDEYLKGRIERLTEIANSLRDAVGDKE